MAKSFIQTIKEKTKGIEYNPVKAVQGLSDARRGAKESSDRFVDTILPKKDYEQDMGANYRNLQYNVYKKILKNKNGRGINEAEALLQEQKKKIEEQRKQFKETGEYKKNNGGIGQ